MVTVVVKTKAWEPGGLALTPAHITQGWVVLQNFLSISEP